MVKVYIQYYEKNENGLLEEIKNYSIEHICNLNDLEFIQELENNDNVYSYNILK
ncbi:MAG: hypothetical protein PHX70_14390 [Clostridium sp.]|nr:hypothetical protein [Clostridium sp.]